MFAISFLLSYIQIFFDAQICWEMSFMQSRVDEIIKKYI